MAPNKLAKPRGSRKNAQSPAPKTSTTGVKKRGESVRATLMESTERLLKRHSPDKITTNMILKESCVARATMYHHFQDSAHLIESAMMSIFSRYVSNNIDLLKATVANSKNKAEFVAGLARVTDISQSSDRRESRFNRARLIALSDGSERLAEILAKEQLRLNRAIRQVFVDAQAQGWIRKDISVQAATVFIQAYTLGKILDDLVPNPIDDNDWNGLIGLFVERTLLTK